MSYSSAAPLPEPFCYPPTYSVEETPEVLEYAPTNIQDNVSPLFTEDVYAPLDMSSPDHGWQGHYWPSPTSSDHEHALYSEFSSQELCYALDSSEQSWYDGAHLEYS